LIGWEDDTIPIYAEFNTHYNNFVICTKRDVWIYNSMTGRIQKCFSEMVDKRTNADLTSFALDDWHWKIFIGDTYGSIWVYNISNGVFIKHVDNIFQKEEEESDEDDKEKLENKIDNIDKSKEVSNLKFISIDCTSYFGNVKMLVTTSWDSSLQVYDESE